MMPIKYQFPPVIETVFSVQFLPIGLGAHHVGLYWLKIRDECPHVEEKAALPKVFDNVPRPPDSNVITIDPQSLPRVWFRAKDGQSIIQLQKDRFICNWRKTSADNQYPSFEVLYPRFERCLEEFAEFVRAENLGELQFDQFELSYINHIEITGQNPNSVDANSLMVDHVRDTSRKRFLPAADLFSWRNVYSLPDRAGRLHINCHSALSTVDDQAPLIRLELTARGFPQSFDGQLRPWFEVAHEYITHGFADSTNLKIQQDLWKRIK